MNDFTDYTARPLLAGALLGVLALFAAVPAATAQETTPTADRLMQRFAQAWSADDTDAIANMVAQDAVFFDANVRHTGHDAFVDYLLGQMEATDEMTITPLYSGTAGDLAVQSGTWTLTYDGGAAEGVHTFIFRRGEDDVWRIVSAHVEDADVEDAHVEDAHVEDADPTDEADNTELIRGAYEAFAAGDVPAVLAIMDPEIRWTEAEGFPYAGTYVGPDAVLENVFMRLGTEWENYRAVPTDYVAEGDKVIVLGEYSGTYKETGRSFEAAFAHVWTVRDGKAVRFVQIADTELVQRALQPPEAEETAAEKNPE